MSTTLYIALDRKIDGIEINNDRVFLAKLIGDPASMGSLCSKFGVKSLCDFQSYDPQLLEEFIEDPNELKTAMAKAQPIQWFEPSEALPVVRALETHFEQAGFIQERERRSHGKWEPLDRTNEIVRELRDLENVLSHAEKAGANFRLYIGF